MLGNEGLIADWTVPRIRHKSSIRGDVGLRKSSKRRSKVAASNRDKARTASPEVEDFHENPFGVKKIPETQFEEVAMEPDYPSDDDD